MIAYVPVGDELAIVDVEDLVKVIGYTWGMQGRGYAQARIKELKGPALMHRLILTPKPGEQVDHINGNKLDNRRANLRSTSNQRNVINRARMKSNTSGYIGVSRCRDKWRAVIIQGGVKLQIGQYPTAFQAALAYDRALTEWAGIYGRYNF